LDYYVNLGRVYDVYLAALDVENLAPGIYYYDLNQHLLDPVHRDITRPDIVSMLIGQPAPLTASCVLLLAVSYQRIQWVYRHDRVMRNAFINAGKVVQDLILVATAFQLTTAISPAVCDSVASTILGLRMRDEQLLHTLSIG